MHVKVAANECLKTHPWYIKGKNKKLKVFILFTYSKSFRLENFQSTTVGLYIFYNDLSVNATVNPSQSNFEISAVHKSFFFFLTFI